MLAPLRDPRVRFEAWAGLAVRLVLLAATVDGPVAAALALGLFALGLVLFPELRRRGIVTALLAAFVAAAIVLLQSG